MINTSVFTKKILTAVLTLGLVACSSAPSVQDFPTTASPGEEVSKFEADLNAARAAQVDVLSPKNFKEAQSSLSDAKKGLEKERDGKVILHDVAQGRAYLNRSNEFATLAHSNIEDVIVARQQAIAAGAPAVRGQEMASADDDLKDVTRAIEKNSLDDAIANRSKLQLNYLDIELQSIKQNRIGQARENMTQALKEGAKKFAPRSLAMTEKSIQDTDAFITGSRHDEAQIAERSLATQKSSEHLLKITRDSKSGKKATSEDLALQIEGEQAKVAISQGQLNVKQGELDDSNDELVRKESQVVKGQNANIALANTNADLESEKAANTRFEDARKQFTKSEAEVYKQGNTLMIRLRGLEFPNAKASIKGSNFPLLAKVQKVIKSFGKSSVVIEGHTDSSGGKAQNEKLSTERAEAVREYLTANSGGETMNITSVGYGYQKPLATNKTAIGRAQNRRVDVLIQPEPTTDTSTN